MRLTFPTAVSIFALAIAFAAPLASSAVAQGSGAAAALPALTNGLGLAAIVNEDVVTELDVDQRVRLLLVTTGVPYSPEAARAARLTALRSLVDETLQFQEARKVNIGVTEAEVEDSFQRVLQSNRVTPEQFNQILASAGVTPATLKRQLRAEITTDGAGPHHRNLHSLPPRLPKRQLSACWPRRPPPRPHRGHDVRAWRAA